MVSTGIYYQGEERLSPLNFLKVFELVPLFLLLLITFLVNLNALEVN